MIASEELPRPSKTSGYFIENEQRAVLRRQPANSCELIPRVEEHATSTLAHWLHNDSGNVVPTLQMLPNAPNHFRLFIPSSFDSITRPTVSRREHRPLIPLSVNHTSVIDPTIKQLAMHSITRVRYRHTPKRIAMITAKNGEELVLVRTGDAPLILE